WRREEVGEAPDKKRAGECADPRAGPAGEGRAAYDDRRNRVEFVGHAVVRIALLELRAVDDSRERRQQTTDREGAELDPIDAHARQPAHRLVAADGIDVTPEGSLVQGDPGDGDRGQKD